MCCCQVSKMLVDLQIENSRIKEKASQDAFELNNKVKYFRR